MAKSPPLPPRTGPAWVALVREDLLYLAWLQACLATAGSLYFSEVRDFVPCVLCWYQRILMYPLVPIIAVGILRRDRGLAAYVLPLTLIGLAIASYHNLLSYGILPESVEPCRAGVSCTARHIEWLGFITIPLLAWIGFAVITLCVSLRSTVQRNEILHEPA